MTVSTESTSHSKLSLRCDPAYVAVLLLVVLTLMVFLPVGHFGFIDYDDDKYVTENPHVLKGLTADGVLWAFKTTEIGFWQPLSWLSHMADVGMFGLNAGGHHMVNLLFHVFSTVILFFALTALTVPIWRSAFVAALFAVHPMHVESVAWIAERKDMLSGFFWTLAILAYVYYAKRPGLGRYMAVLGCFVLGLMSKPVMVTLPVVLLLLDYWPLGRFAGGGIQEKARSLAIEKLPMIGLAVASGVITFFTEMAGRTIEVMPLKGRVANAAVSYAMYVIKMFYPVRLSVIYPIGSMGGWNVIFAVCAIGIVSVAAVWNMKRYPYIFTGWFWFLVVMAPSVGIVKFGAMMFQSMADRYTYIPYIGLFIIAAMGVPRILKNYRRLSGVLCLAVVLICAFLSVKQLTYWKDSITLFTRVVSITKDNGLAYNNLACALTQKGRDLEALAAFKRAISIYPNSAVIHVNAANLMLWTNRKDDALMHFKTAIALDPDISSAYIGAGVALLMLNEPREAIPYFEKALVLEPNLTAAVSYLNAAKAQVALGGAAGGSTVNPPKTN
ncbi:tetratricopeptide repeat protein [Candidatus Magnetominusculus dajiuhuensis]|uniref:tetratricopeptide repeat protein n=1 Tax=Candidatus Magnetominusculus dajiuhuensis TaxID=3137712 RepID=UPI003B43175D